METNNTSDRYFEKRLRDNRVLTIVCGVITLVIYGLSFLIF
jgi:hypothetical protein